jgi:hypothetical protein
LHSIPELGDGQQNLVQQEEMKEEDQVEDEKEELTRGEDDEIHEKKKQ